MVMGCRVPSLTTSPVVSLAAAHPQPSGPLGVKEVRQHLGRLCGGSRT